MINLSVDKTGEKVENSLISSKSLRKNAELQSAFLNKYFWGIILKTN